MSKKAIDILIVEDDPADIFLIKAGLKQSEENPLNLHVVNNGEEAMKFLYKRGIYESAPRPQLMILDLNMPRKNGRQILTEIKKVKELKNIPIVVLTTSNAADDIDLSYKLGANSYMIKADNLQDFQMSLAALERYWCKAVSLPTQ